MAFVQPTYEQYESATAFAKFKYKYGMLITILCWIALLYIIFYMVTNVKELTANPLQYGAEEMGIECNCYDKTRRINFWVNSTDMWIITMEELDSQQNYSEINLTLWKELNKYK